MKNNERIEIINLYRKFHMWDHPVTTYNWIWAKMWNAVGRPK